ncbi:uncharacterized protein K441DRAFT_742416 [Cenococcum geophilum 1.58]|uniref:Uncharacterized protein n=1 Tax=Cenococcum geophilum 1.58 TaxID=794803 RepID=A0ACC8EMH5_9PEZI|nr:hypothetical protein K441DRAFT_742416 [Cenococcum geophilum 1.58]
MAYPYDPQLGNGVDMAMMGEMLQEPLQIDPRHQQEHERSDEQEMDTNQGPCCDRSRIELLEGEVEDLESMLESEQSKTEALSEELEQMSQELERLRTEGERDLNEARAEVQTSLNEASKRVEIAAQELKEKKEALLEVEEELLQSKQIIQQHQKDLHQKEQDLGVARQDSLRQQTQLSSQLQEAERGKQDLVSQLVVMQGQFTALQRVQQEDLVAQELGEELAHTKTELESSLQELKQCHALIGALETQQGNMSMELQRSQEQMAEISGQRAQLESRMRNLENELAEREENHQTLIGQQRSSWQHLLLATIEDRGPELAEKLFEQVRIEDWFRWQDDLRKIFSGGTARPASQHLMFQRSFYRWSERISRDYLSSLKRIDQATSHGPALKWVALRFEDAGAIAPILHTLKSLPEGTSDPVVHAILANLEPSGGNAKLITDALSRLVYVTKVGMQASLRVVEGYNQNSKRIPDGLVALILKSEDLAPADERALKAVVAVLEVYTSPRR